MVRISFECSLGSDELYNMAVVAKNVRDDYDYRHNPNEWNAWNMLYNACMDLRKK